MRKKLNNPSKIQENTRKTVCFLALTGTLLMTNGCANNLNSRNRVDMSAQPPKYEAPYDQIPQTVDEQYMLNYNFSTLSDTENQDPNPVQIYPENYRTENKKPSSTRRSQTPLEAIPAPNKPGFVISPYAPDAGLVDIRDFSPGMEVRDPYSGEIMLIPIEKQTPNPETKINKQKNMEETGSPFLQKAPPPETGPVIRQGPPLNVQ